MSARFASAPSTPRNVLPAPGLDVDRIASAKHDAGSFADAGLVDPDAEALTVDCDVLVPSALEGAIDADVAGQVTASYDEWAVDLGRVDHTDVHEPFRRRLEQANAEVWSSAERRGIDPRTAAASVALERIRS